MNTETFASRLMDILIGNRDECTCVELDGRFLLELNALNLPEADCDEVFNAWLTMTEHVLGDKRTLTDDGRKVLMPVLERIVTRHIEDLSDD